MPLNFQPRRVQPPRSAAAQSLKFPILFEIDAIRSILAGRKTQDRRLAQSALGVCRPGDRLWVRERFAPGRVPAGQSREHFCALGKAEFVVCQDGWRQFRDGSGHFGPKLARRSARWMPAMQMPRWASRATLLVHSAHFENLQSATASDISDEGMVASFGGVFWHRYRPRDGIWRNPSTAYAAYWNKSRSSPGERWQDDPIVVALRFQLEW